MDVACGVVGFIGLAGQCLQGCKWLHDFFGDVKHAPKIINDTAEEIQVLLMTLASFHKVLKNAELSGLTSKDGFQDARPALNLCKSVIEDLIEFVSKYSAIAGSTPTPASDLNTLQLKWKTIDCALKKPKLKEYLARLQQAKISLLAVQCNILISINNSQSTELQTTRKALLAAMEDQSDKIIMAVKLHAAKTNTQSRRPVIRAAARPPKPTLHHHHQHRRPHNHIRSTKPTTPASSQQQLVLQKQITNLTTTLHQAELAREKQMRILIILPCFVILISPLSLGATILGLK